MIDFEHDVARARRSAVGVNGVCSDAAICSPLETESLWPALGPEPGVVPEHAVAVFQNNVGGTDRRRGAVHFEHPTGNTRRREASDLVHEQPERERLQPVGELTLSARRLERAKGRWLGECCDGAIGRPEWAFKHPEPWFGLAEEGLVHSLDANMDVRCERRGRE